MMSTLAVNGGDVWFAVEFDTSGTEADELAQDLDVCQPEVDLWYWNGSTYTKRSLGNDRLDEAHAFHYPTIDLWDSDEYVFVLTKQDVNQPDDECDTSYPCAQLEVYRQDADDMTAAWSRQELHDTTPDHRAHGRPHLASETVTDTDGTQYACWTSSRPDDPGGDVYDDWSIKAKEYGESWALGDLGTEEGADDEVEDHCMVGHDDAGQTFTVWHHCNDTSQFPCATDEHLHVRWDYYSVSGGTWTTQADVQLALPYGGGDADFPTIAVDPTFGTSDPPYHVVVANDKNDDDQLFVWLCSGSASSCDLASDWVGPDDDSSYTVDPDGINARMPHVVFAEPANIVIAFQNENSLDIGFVAACDWTDDFPNSVTFTSVGIAPTPNGYDGLRFTPAPGTPVPAMAYDATTDTVHASFVARKSGFTDYWDPVHFSAPLSDFCP